MAYDVRKKERKIYRGRQLLKMMMKGISTARQFESLLLKVSGIVWLFDSNIVFDATLRII